MKRILSVLLCLVSCLMFGCTNNQNANDGTPVKSVDSIIIQDSTFVSQANDIYKNPDNYKDTLIVVQGIYATTTVNNKAYHYVIRTAKSADGTSKTVGFEFKYDGKLPNENDWIEICGNVEPSTGADGNESVILDVIRIETLETRGQETV